MTVKTSQKYLSAQLVQQSKTVKNSQLTDFDHYIHVATYHKCTATVGDLTPPPKKKIKN